MHIKQTLPLTSRLLASGSRAGACFVVLAVVAMLFLASCAGLKKSQTSTDLKTPQDTSRSDTSKSKVASAIDSAAKKVEGMANDINKGIEDVNSTIDNAVGKVTDFFGSFIPGLKRKDSVMVVLPPTVPNPAVTVTPPEPDGFLKSPIEQKIIFDSLGNVSIENEFLGGKTKIGLSQSLDDYINQRLEANSIEDFRSAAEKTTASPGAGAGSTNATDKGGGGILSDYGSISIPIPPSIVPTIFGKPSINLRVNGDVAVHIAYRDNQFLATSGAVFSGSETGLDFRQEINMSLSGSVGDKIKINTDFASLRQFSFENLFKLSYQGYPEEIIQSIEAGNVSLTTPSKYIGIQSALFGFKAVNRFGPLYLTAVAAQKKGERQSKDFGGGPGAGAGNEFNVQPANYRRNSFFLDASFIDKYEAYYSTEPPDASKPNLVAEGSVQVWRSTSQINVKSGGISHFLWYDLPPVAFGSTYADNPWRLTPAKNTGFEFKSSFMELLDTNQYKVDYKTGVVTLLQEPSDNQNIAVSFTLAAGNLQIGERTSGQEKPYVLKLIKPEFAFKRAEWPTWKLILKNSYYIGATNVDDKNFNVKIQYTYPTGEVTESIRTKDKREKTISVMGLDRYDNANPGNKTPDGQVDLFYEKTAILDKRNGTLTFPYLEPFGKVILDYVAGQPKRDTLFYIPEIYTTPRENFANIISKNTSVAINIKYSGGTSSTLNLNAFNIVEGSVRVTSGGRQLVEGVDYRVDINSGTVTLLKPDLATAGPISVDYDQHDFFTTTTKNLLGLRGDIPILDRGLLGFSLLNYSQRQQSLKTRQGEEPFSNWVAGADLSYMLPSMKLTNLLNALPIFNLKERSEITIRADAALSLPNPNTQVSPMSVDGGKSIAYLDDFEGGKTNFMLGMNYGKWVHSSQPDSVEKYLGKNKGQINSLKSKMFWYEKVRGDVPLPDIKPNKSTATPNQTAQVLDVVYEPQTHGGIYNHYSDKTEPDSNRWAGMMQWYQGLNVPATNTDAIEFWVHKEDLSGNNNGFIHFDIGKISEDVIPDGKLETEDKNNNGRYDPGEDVGLDTISTSVEQDSLPGAFDPNDPNNDNYGYDRISAENNYRNINGTEGNANDYRSGLRPDNEDLDGNGAVNLENSYFEYDIPLRENANKYIIGQSPKGWFQYRIPLSDFARTVGSPDLNFNDISYYRMWFSGYPTTPGNLHLRFYEITLVGSQWTHGKKAGTIDTSSDRSGFEINYVNIEDNSLAPTFYTAPPGAQRDKLTGQSSVVYGNEQSISLSTKCLPTGEAREAVRIFPTPNDLFNYRSMAIWVHGDVNRPKALISPLDTSKQLWVYIRFGSDQYNYYEYRRPLVNDWQNMFIDYVKLAALKASKLKRSDTATAQAGDGVFGSMYRVVGSPNVTNAPIFTLGIENHTDDGCLATDVWFDELRLLEGNDKVDYAMNGSIQAKLAEFGTITGNIVNERPDFHRVDERFNRNRSLNSSWGLTGEFQMQKMFPAWLERGSVFPLTVSHNEFIQRPKYQTNTDVPLADALQKIQDNINNGSIPQAAGQQLMDSIRLNNETLTVRNSIAATGVKFNFPGSFFLLPGFINRLTYGFGYGEEFQRSPQYEYNRSWSWTGSLYYDLSNVPKVPLSPLKWISPDVFSIGRYSNYTINFLPQRFTWGFSMTRGRKHTLDRSSTNPIPPDADPLEVLDILRSRVPQLNRVFAATRGVSFSWKLSENGFLSPQIDYGLDVSSNLAHLETIEARNGSGNAYDSAYFYQRTFGDIMKDIFFTKGRLANLDNDFVASQRIKLTTQPRLPWLFWIDKFIRPTFSYNVDYKWINAQTGYQNAKTGYWSNVINMGIELNLRELGIGIFGSDQPPAVARGRGGRQSSAGQTNSPNGANAGGMDNVTPLPGSPFEEVRSAGRPHVTRVGDANMPTTPGQSAFLDSLGKKMNPIEPPPPAPKQQVDTNFHVPGVGTEGERTESRISDTTLTPIAPPEPPKEIVEEEPSTLVSDILKAVIQKPFFDWNGTRFNFIQTNSSLNGALQGNGSGITNFWAGGFTHPEWDDNGPSRAYQLGLITDPHGRLLIKFKPQFPFVGFEVRHGYRAPSPRGGSINITDVFTQKNTFELATSRPLWAGAQISFNWKTEFTYNEHDNIFIDKNGFDSVTSRAKMGDVSRTFLSIPPLPFLNITQSGIQNVGKKWEEKTAAIGAFTPQQRDSLAPDVRNRLQVESFLEGFESLPLFTSKLREFLPRLNYSFSWSGMEKFPLFSFADRVSFRHGYTGNYKRVFRLDPGDSVQLTTIQTVAYGFRPLIALDFGWDKILGGKMTASLNYDTQTEWGADYASNRITKRLSTTFGINANYSREGLKLPFINLTLKNNFGMSFLLSQTISSDIFFQFNTITTNPAGTGNGGITKTTIEPRFSYDINQQLTIEGFYRYERTIPAATGVLIPPTRLIMAGFDIRLKIF